ncbi:MAG: Adenylate cyclase 2 [Bacteroidia bacterium]|nr:Adenylate cyclase 2 [Bacteroidia bacterium]
MATILIVDDNPGNLKAYKNAISDEFQDSNIITASNEEEAIKIINESVTLDVVVTDLMMKSETAGIDVLNAVQKRDPLIMVIIITAYEKILDRNDAFKKGAFDCLEKSSVGGPTINELIYKIKSAIFTRSVALESFESRRKIDSFKKYFDPGVFDKIKQNPELLTPKNRIVTIVFWDIRGFSSLSEILKADTSLIAGFLKEYLEASSKIIFSKQGVLDKFIGDGVMALFGAFDEKGENEEKNAIAAIEAAVALRREFNVILLKWEKIWQRVTADNIDIGLGCGIHTGEVLVGNLGTDNRDHFTAIGPHINLAARIESTAQKEEIRFSVTTKSRIDDHFRCTKIDTLKDVKNIKGSFDIFRINE